MPQDRLDAVYTATDTASQRVAYDHWAAEYERDLCAMGYRLPAIAAAVFCRYVPMDGQPVLDAGCGTGMQAEAIAAAGYTPLIGIDLSEGMLDVARSKRLYSELRAMTLGDTLDFDTGAFAAVLSTGAITPGHAPPESFDELIRVTAPGGLLVFSLRVDSGQDPAYIAALTARTARTALWEPVYETPSFQTMPYGEPAIQNRVYVYRKV